MAFAQIVIDFDSSDFLATVVQTPTIFCELSNVIHSENFLIFNMGLHMLELFDVT